VTATLSTSTLAVAFGLGVLAIALAPLLTVRRVRSMDVPSALRVIE
jgi:putative ABC transport system permease protein